MAIFTGSALLELVTILVTVFFVTWAFFKWSFTYWTKRNVPILNPTFPFGDFEDLIKVRGNIGQVLAKFYKEFKSKGYIHGGVYNFIRPIYVPVDLKLIKNIITKDFHHFVDHALFIDEKNDPLSAHLFSMKGDAWKNLRQKLTPTFTSGKMKMMFQTLVESSHGLESIIDSVAASKQTVEIKDIVGRFTTDVIGSCAFGIECNSIEDPDTPFRIYGKRQFENSGFEAIKIIMTFIIPERILKFFNYKLTKPDVENFFLNLVKDTVNYRETNNIYRKDFLHLLIQLKNIGKVMENEKLFDDNVNNNDPSKLTLNEISAQAFIFFLAGFETSSTLMTFAMLELAKNQEVQDKLRDEINTVLKKHDGKYTYEGFWEEMKYLDQVLNETLRKYPPAPALNRVCTKDYQVPGTSVIIDKGTLVFIPIMGIQNDKDFFPDPDKFDPDRFSEENKNSIPKGSFIPFGDGPRACIGLRFGMLQAKIGLATILKNHVIKLDEQKTNASKMNNRSFITTVEGGVWLSIKKI